ncbi:MAG: hypothetical protein LBC25_01925, partial [Holosporales bacterium]|jgi:4-diphosphocytidyl-2-C-methyl-D-erythritol kinase|nr:hypothetical protein [Holosporales bacterium]
LFQPKIPHVEIEKRIPIGSGLGGGSSDAARFIATVFDIWQIPLEKRLESIKFFKSLGSDAIVFLYRYFLGADTLCLDGTGFEEGSVFPLSISGLNDLYVIVVHDGICLSTKMVYDNFAGPLQPTLDMGNCALEFLEDFHNSLQDSAISLVPEIRDILNSIEETGPRFCGVSGAGSSCFGLYDSRSMAEKAGKSLSTYGYDFVRISRI